MTEWYGAIEAGGTKFVCAIGRNPDEILAQTRFPTTTPDETLARAIAFFRSHDVSLSAIGIASFGPIDLDRNSPTWGYVTTTPKPHWSQIDLAGTIQRALNVPVGFDTDVNGAALGEARWGSARGLTSALYFTIGTGIGGGGILGGKLMHGLLHPEMGHMRLPHDLQRDPFEGSCPYHKNCFEGLASGPAMQARWGVAAETLPPEHPAWELEAEYIALAMMNVICIVSPQKIILGGGVMHQTQLLPMIRRKVQVFLNGYVQAEAVLSDIDSYIVPPQLGDLVGVSGALALAIDAASECEKL